MVMGVTTLQRFSWMGCCGTISRLVDVSGMRAGDDKNSSVMNYSCRRVILAVLQNHLRTIKADLDLIPEEELNEETDRAGLQRLDEEVAEKRRRSLAESKSQQICDASAVGEDCQVDPNSVSRQSNAHDMPAMYDTAAVQNLRHDTLQCSQNSEEYDSAVSPVDQEDKVIFTKEVTQEQSRTHNDLNSAVLAEIARSPEEMHQALSTFTAVVRGSLISMGAAYTSYLDGSQHTSLSKLDAYNAQHATVGADPTFCTDHLRHALEEYNAARTALEQHRVQNEFAYATRVQPGQNAYYPAEGVDAQRDIDAALTKQQLLENVSRACMTYTVLRSLYNQKASEHAPQNA